MFDVCGRGGGGGASVSVSVSVLLSLVESDSSDGNQYPSPLEVIELGGWG